MNGFYSPLRRSIIDLLEGMLYLQIHSLDEMLDSGSGLKYPERHSYSRDPGCSDYWNCVPSWKWMHWPSARGCHAPARSSSFHQWAKWPLGTCSPPQCCQAWEHLQRVSACLIAWQSSHVLTRIERLPKIDQTLWLSLTVSKCEWVRLCWHNKSLSLQWWSDLKSTLAKYNL